MNTTSPKQQPVSGTSKTPLYFYHYSAMTQLKNGSINYFDGFVHRPTSLNSQELCTEMKDFIAGCCKTPPKKLVITSLTLVSDPLES